MEDLLSVELESALLDNCTLNDINYICKGKFFPELLRPDIWQVCLDVRHKEDQLQDFNNIFDLPFQNELHEDCKVAVETLSDVSPEERASVLHDIESMLTFYSKRHNCRKYNRHRSGWLDVLLPIMELKLSRSITFNMFEAIQMMYIPCTTNTHIYSMFRLLLLYHDPQLCSLLDTKKISPDSYALKWFNSLFAGNCNVNVIHGLWDLYFQYADPFLIFFFGIIILINGRSHIISLKDSDKNDLANVISKMPCGLAVDDITDFCLLAQYYAMRTPSSFKTYFLKTLFGSRDEDSLSDDLKEMSTISQSLCLPVSVYELVETFCNIDANPHEGVRFFLIDCRPAEQYNAGHFSTAFHLDCSLMVHEPEAFGTAIQGLLSSRQQSIDMKSNAAGEHFCFMGSGSKDEDQYIHMIISSFLQKNHTYVSLLSGGYQAMHDYFEDYMMDYLDDHNKDRCLVCLRSSKSTKNLIKEKLSQQRQSSGKPIEVEEDTSTTHLLSRFSAIMRFKGAEVKDKLMGIISHQPSQNNRDKIEGGLYGHQQYHHVRPNERFNRRYRQDIAVFSIDGNGDQLDAHQMGRLNSSLDTRKTKEPVLLKNFLNSPDIQYSFKCEEVHLDGHIFDACLAVTKSQIIALRELDAERAEIVSCRPLVSIVKITSKKRHPDLITFKYGHAQGNNLIITEVDRFIIPNSNEVTSLLSNYIVQILDGTLVDE